MAEVIFCKTRYQDVGYLSYNDLWRMVELAGYPIIYVDQIDPQSDNTYIVTPLNDEWLTGWQSPKARIIHWELEWRTDWRATIDEPSGIAEVWAIDKSYADKIGARYVPVGGDERLCPFFHSITPIGNRKYDVSLLSYQTPRRQVITQQLRDEHLILAPIDNLTGMNRSLVLVDSKVMVHVHQLDNMAGIASLRWCLAAAHYLPMISETVPDRGIFGYTHMMQADYSFLASFTASALRDRRMLSDYAEALHGLLCEKYTFRKSVDSHV